ncbi:MAG TPA: NADH-quinone oxidoreductase subunit L [Candidatus Latescibacteria bacterium]|nr:NADH-quinone oxidoreductase subunit L [Candidatus Latescibacterota bacterium]
MGFYLLLSIALPALLGFCCLILAERLKATRGAIVLVGTAASLGLGIYLFLKRPLLWPEGGSALLKVDDLSGFILLAAGTFGLLITIYSLRFMADKGRLREYYAYLLWTIAASYGVLLSTNLVLLLTFWGFLGLTLYLLIGLGGPDASQAATKTLIIVGGADALMVLGVAILWLLTGTFRMDEINLPIGGALSTIAFLSLAAGAFAKAGAMPLHTWIPDMAERAPLPVTAFLPASLDKLLGIYLLVRISMDFFVLNKLMAVVLMAIGAATIVLAVMMALIQHNLKRLLGYHAVSQVGYMVLGIGTGIPVAVAGGLFHMLNNAIYKCCLFLTGGAVEYRARTSELDDLGGLAKAMPFTFIASLIAALSISGVPPLNGFVSKWMIYQGIIELGGHGDRLWFLWLAAAMFGSALTLASFMKLIHATFLGMTDGGRRAIKEVPATMWLPSMALAGLCVVFGVFAFLFPLKLFIMPAVPGVSFFGLWRAGTATVLIIVGIVIGTTIYGLGRLFSALKARRPIIAGSNGGYDMDSKPVSNPTGMAREDVPYVGGELVESQMRVSGIDFYQTIRDLGPLRSIYNKAERRAFDIYNLGKGVVFYFVEALRYIHSGILPTYLSWCLIGLAVLLFITMR